MKAAKRLENLGYENVVIFDTPSYDDALIGVSEDNRAVYDYDKMVVWLAVTWGISREDAMEFIEYNTLRALPYCGAAAPIVMRRI